MDDTYYLTLMNDSEIYPGFRKRLRTDISQNKILYVFFLVFLGTVQIFSVNGQNRWEGYYSYKNCFDILETSDFIVGATELGLILFDKESGAISVRNKINGLSDSGISAIGGVEGTNKIFVGYSDGNIDIIEDGKVINIPDLKIQKMSGSKNINHFLYFDNSIYCSTDFGILQIDLKKYEITSTFIIGENASSIKVYGTTINSGYIYAATASGLLRADRTAALVFYDNWKLFSQTSSAFCAVTAFEDGVLAARGETGSTCKLIKIDENGSSEIGNYNSFRNFTISGDQVFVTTQSKIFSFNSFLSGTGEIDSVTVVGNEKRYQPVYRDALLANGSGICFADWNGGFFIENTDGSFEQILPDGPYSNKVFKTESVGDELWVVPGGFGAIYDNANTAPSVSVLRDGEWLSFNTGNTPEFSNVRDLINIEANPLDANNVFVSSWGNGLFEFDKDKNDEIFLKYHYVAENSGLENYPNTPKDRYIRVWGLTFDEDGNLFMNNSDVQSVIVVYDKQDSAWYHNNYGVMAFGAQKVGEILIDDQGYKWMPIVSGEKGLFVYDDNGTISDPSDDRYRCRTSTEDDTDSRNAGALKLWDENGELLTEIVYCLAKDKSGYIWIGTDIGVLVQYDPYDIFNLEKPVFTRIKVPRNDGSGLADYLLENQKVTAIAIDGANRKYFGTENSGIYIISEDGTKTVAHFTSGNSPLPSDNIVNLDIDEESGKVYIATEEGLISYRGDAVKGKSTFSNVYAYPNPVRPEYEGTITITGLVDRTNVKITDAAGNLVYETISLGGNALWDGKNLWGQKVKAGVYIVFLVSPDGTQSGFTKIAVVR